MSDIEEARKAMIAKRFGGNTKGASTGGSGTVRRKNKGSIKAGAGKLHATLRQFRMDFMITFYLYYVR